jgi:hypothetical protein
MTRHAGRVAGLVLSLLAAGCSNQEAATPDVVAAGAAESRTPTKSPADVVTAFLEAIRAGDEAQARSLLTAVAQDRTAALGIQIAPPWDERARYEVGETELQENEVEESLNIVWALRQEPEGWRVAGLATKMFDNQSAPTVLNYENPEEMLRQFEEIEQMASETPDAAPGDPETADVPARRRPRQ